MQCVTDVAKTTVASHVQALVLRILESIMICGMKTKIIFFFEREK